jgi:MFS family permease
MTWALLLKQLQVITSRLYSILHLQKRKVNNHSSEYRLTVTRGAVVSIFTGGGFFGAFLAGPTGDYFGRKLTIMTGALIFCLGGGLQTGAQSLSYLYTGRCLAGVG